MTSNFDEHRWVIQIRRIIDDELEEDTETPVSIFNVPKTLLAINPDSYIPQQVALGPYHRWRPELHETKRYKLGAAKRMQKQLQSINFHSLVDQLTKLELRIRASYHKYLDFNGETLAWMMAIDASFLLEFLQIYALKQGKSTIARVLCSRMSHLVDIAGRKPAHIAILRDMVMLENQIPLFLLRKMLEFQFLLLELADDMLHSMLMGLCQEISPFKMVKVLPNLQVSKHAHMLDFLYHVIVTNWEDIHQSSQVTYDQVDQDQNEVKEGEEQSFANSSYVKQLLVMIWEVLSKFNKGPFRVIQKLPWGIISNLPPFRLLKQKIELSFFSQDIEPQNENSSNSNSTNSNSTNSDKPPMIVEIKIPSVTDLSKAGVRFLPTEGGISNVSFDLRTNTLYLPPVSLDMNTEVIMRNLVADEACNASGPLVFTRYTELMNEIVDNEDDAKLLREKGIILNHLKSNGEVANLWNGMSKSIRLTKVPVLDKVIEDVNKYYNGRWNIKVGKFMKIYVFGSWQFLTFLATIFLLLLMSLQAFCSVYTCARIFDVQTS